MPGARITSFAAYSQKNKKAAASPVTSGGTVTPRPTDAGGKDVNVKDPGSRAAGSKRALDDAGEQGRKKAKLDDAATSNIDEATRGQMAAVKKLRDETAKQRLAVAKLHKEVKVWEAKLDGLTREKGAMELLGAKVVNANDRFRVLDVAGGDFVEQARAWFAIGTREPSKKPGGK
jgi:hypothetical protein